MGNFDARLKQLEKGDDPERFAEVKVRLLHWAEERRKELLAYGPRRPADAFEAMLLCGQDPEAWAEQKITG